MENPLSSEEKKRLDDMSRWEKQCRKEGYRIIAGVDEAGRGPLAGPVVAASCILPEHFLLQDLNDSKKVPSSRRKELFTILTQDKRVIFGIGIIDHKTIDEINIHQATLLAMKKAIDALPFMPDVILFDGKQTPACSCHSIPIVRGDSLSISIAAASIIAKETRDRIMEDNHHKWPQYGFDHHKGYATKKHVDAIFLHGPCPIHRRSFEPIKTLIEK